MSTAKKVTEFFKKRESFFVDYAGGRIMHVDFREFPTLGVAEYDKMYGVGTAQKVLEKYNATYQHSRFDKYDQCSFLEAVPIACKA